MRIFSQGGVYWIFPSLGETSCQVKDCGDTEVSDWEIMEEVYDSYVKKVGDTECITIMLM